MKRLNILTIAVLAAILGFGFTGCGGKRQAAAPGYPAHTTAPTTAAQAQAADRGVLVQQEPCEAMAFEPVDSFRESGIGLSDRESFATDLALLNARARMAQRLTTSVSGMIRNFNQQYGAGADQWASVEKAGGLQQAYFEQFLTNTKQICKNTYVRQDGRYNVYVCIEMNDNEILEMHKKLTDDKMLQIDFSESQFQREMAKEREDYRRRAMEQYN